MNGQIGQQDCFELSDLLIHGVDELFVRSIAENRGPIRVLIARGGGYRLIG